MAWRQVGGPSSSEPAFRPQFAVPRLVRFQPQRKSHSPFMAAVALCCRPTGNVGVATNGTQRFENAPDGGGTVSDIAAAVCGADLPSPHPGRVVHVVRISVLRTSTDRRALSGAPALPFGALRCEAATCPCDLMHVVLSSLVGRAAHLLREQGRLRACAQHAAVLGVACEWLWISGLSPIFRRHPYHSNWRL